MSALRSYRQGLRVGYRDFRDFWNVKTWCGGWMLRISTSCLAWVLMGRMLGSEAQLRFLLVGNAVAAGAAAALWASNASVWFRYDGTHALNVVAPTSMLPVVVGRTSIWLFNGVATSLAAFAVLVLAFDYRPAGSAAWAAAPLLVVVCASAFCFALFLGALVGRRTRLRNLVLDAAGTMFLALCGASVPLSFWPAGIRALARFLPVTHGLSAIRALLDGGPAAYALRETALEALVGAGWLLLAVLLTERLAEAGRADGSIEHY